RKRRSRNLVIKGMYRVNPDQFVATFESIFDQLTSRNYTFQCFYRGQVLTDGTRCIVVKISDPASRLDILRNSKRLRNTPWAYVYICPDLTPMQSVEDYQLRSELKILRSNNPANQYVIKHGQIQMLQQSLRP